MKGFVNCSAISPDGSVIGLGSQKGSVLLYSNLTTTPSVLSPILVASKYDWVESICWFCDSTNRNILACSVSKTIFVFQVEGSECKVNLLTKLEKHDQTVQGLVWDKSRDRLLSFSNKQVLLWSFAKGAVPDTCEEFQFDSLLQCFAVPASLQQDLICVGSRDGDCLIWDGPNRNLGRPLSVVRSDDSRNEAITSICFGMRSNKFLVASSNTIGTIEVYRIADNIGNSSSTGLFRGHRAAISVLKTHSQLSNVIASGGHDGVIYVWDILVGGKNRAALARLVTKDTLPPPAEETNDNNNNETPSAPPPVREYKDISQWVKKLEWNQKGDVLTAGFCHGKIAVWKFAETKFNK